jgi:hypothetical protein
MPSFLNNREWATVIWFAVGVIWVLTRRPSLAELLVAFIKPSKLSGLVWATAGYVAALVILGRGLGLWTNALIGSTVLWFVGAALILLLSATRVSEKSGFMRRTLIRTAGLAALVAGYAALYVFPLVVELMLLPMLAVVVAMVAVAEQKDEFANVRTPLNSLIAIAGVTFLVYVTAHLASDMSGAHLGSALPKCSCACRLCPSAARATVIEHRAALGADWRSLALPIWLMIALLPFIYIAGLLIAYESSFLLIDLCLSQDTMAKRRAKLALLLGVNVRARYLGDFRAPWPMRLVREPDLRRARDVVRQFRSSPRR